MQNPKFSIIVPIYNAQEFIANALQSAINQSFKDIEIICVDDKSSDESVRVIKEFMAKDNRIRLVCNEQNLGTFATRNKGALSARGEYLLFLDADDSFDLRACEMLNESLKGYEKSGTKIDILGFNYTDDEKDTPNFYENSQLFSQKEYVYRLVTHRWQGGYWCIWDKAFLRQGFVKSLEMLNFNKKLVMAEDALACFNALLYAKSCACLNERLYFHRTNPSSIMQRKDEKKLKISIENHNFVIEKLLELSSKFNGFESLAGRVFAIDLKCSLINEKRRLDGSFLTYIITSLQKKFLRFRRKKCVEKMRK